jgi:hypothetical protein
MRAGGGKAAAFWYFDPDGWDWLALVRANVETGSLQCFLLPHDKAIALSVQTSDGRRRLQYKNAGLQAYEDNFTLVPGGR